MTTCLGKSCSFGLLCACFVNVYKFVCASFPFGFEGGMWDLIPDHCLSIFFPLFVEAKYSIPFLFCSIISLAQLWNEVK